MEKRKPVIVWFRQDLRVSDNPALCAAAKVGAPVLPIYVLDDENAGELAMGAASRWWLHHSLSELNSSLDGALRFFKGKADDILPQLVAETGAIGVYWNRCYEPWRITRDAAIKSRLQSSHCTVRSYNGSLLFEPPNISKADGSPYRVFTPYYTKGCLEKGPPPRSVLGKPEAIDFFGGKVGARLGALELMPNKDWYSGLAHAWSPGEPGASRNLALFLEQGLDGYKEGRNRPDQQHVSRLSPHLHFGEISPHQIQVAVNQRALASTSQVDTDHFLSEIGWREFSNNLLYHWRALPRENLQRKFNRFPWRNDPAELQRWQRGTTGYPMVDAGMRELWQTGYMHNRVRMIVGSFLVKNLLLHWHHGADWFWDTLVDADLANNSASWQWIAGCGADAAPYFRVFNPLTQGQKFDPEGSYVRRYVPELAGLPHKFVHRPWEAPPAILQEAGISLGDNYPYPVVDLKTSRERALLAFRSLTSAAD